MDPITITGTDLTAWEQIQELEEQIEESSNDLGDTLSQEEIRDELARPEPGQEERITGQAVGQQITNGDVDETLGVGFQEEPSRGKDGVNLDISDTSEGGGRDQYIAKLEQDFAKAIDQAKLGDMAALKKIFADTNDRIVDDMRNGNITDGNQDFSEKDIMEAVKLMQNSQQQVLDRLRQHAANAGSGGGTTDNSEADKAYYDALARQSRIDKWESLKDQEYVNYLKATLAGIKASEKLAASAR